MDAGQVLAQAREHAQSSTPAQGARDPLAAWERLSDPVEVEGGYGVAFFAKRKSTGVEHACFQRGTDGTGRVTGIPVISAPALGLVPASVVEETQEEPAPEAKPETAKSKSRAQK